MDNLSLDHILCLEDQAVLYTKGSKSALFDCGMAHKLPFNEIEQRLNGSPLDFLFLTHSHYDHLGAVPLIRERWPECQVLGSAYAAYVLTRPGALATIREFSIKAAALDDTFIPDYSDSQMKIDTVLTDGDIVDLGGSQVQAIELIGHTKCSMGYFIDGTILVASETTGYLNEYGDVIPSFLISGKAALNSIEICRKLNPSVIIPPHGSPILVSDCPDYWDRCRAAILHQNSLVRDYHKAGKTEAEILQLIKALQWNGEIQKAQPEFAYEVNMAAMIRITLAEAAQEEHIING